MKERPILFNGPMVRAILGGSKTQTRRIMKPQPEPIPGEPGKHWWPSSAAQSMCRVEDLLQLPEAHGLAGDCCPHGGHGDRLWVRETWADLEQITDGSFARQAIYRADDIEQYGDEDEFVDVTSSDMRWRPSIHMPRWASRILLEIVSVRVERLQDISEVDAIAEGATHIRSQAWDREHFPAWRYLFEEAVAAGTKQPIGPSPAQAYEKLWESINGAGSWVANPWVWAVEFKRVAP